MIQLTDNQFLSTEIHQKIKEVVTSLNSNQLLWLNGYLTAAVELGLLSSEKNVERPVERVSDAVQSNLNANTALSLVEEKEEIHAKPLQLKILVGSQSGNSQRVADRVYLEAQKAGISSSVVSLTDFNLREITNESHFVLVVSTYGEGEPPVAALDLYELFNSKKAPKLEGKQFAVIALGDSAYKKFCQTGIDFFNLFQKQGAKPVSDLVKLDVDFQEQLPGILPSIISAFTCNASEPAKTSKVENVAVLTHQTAEVPVVEKVQLNGRGSSKETWHLELSTEGSGLVYEPGDALEVYARNNPELVDAVIAQLGLTGDELVVVDGQIIRLREALEHHYELTIVTPQVLKKYITKQKDIQTISENVENLLEKSLEGTDILDLLREYPIQLKASELLELLRKLPPRLYSISSSQLAVGDEVHITVGAVRFEKDERPREGVCSTFLADRLCDDENLKVRIRPNNHFRLPANGDVPVIMIGAGTGIAPFRAFVQHREATKAKGENWLVFGDQYFATDFLYQSEWLKYRKDGLLTRIDVAFSRDQNEKIYVQDRLKENAAELFSWIEAGANIYVCGDMKRMARDVKQVVIEVIAEQGRLSHEAAEKRLNQLKKEGRYLEDVY